MTDQVNQTGDQGDKGDKGTGDQAQSLGWRAALPDEFKEHEFVKTFQKPGDFVKSALEIKTERDTLKTKLDGAIPKLGDKATAEEKAAFRKALGVPDKPDGYKFVPADGVEHSPEMVKWAQGVFHEFGIPADAAAGIQAKWDTFLMAMEEMAAQEVEKAKQEAMKTFRAEFKSDEEYKAAEEGVRRIWKEVTKGEFDAFCDDTGIGNHPMLIKLIYHFAKKTGEDFSPKGKPGGGGKPAVGMIYDKSPDPSKSL